MVASTVATNETFLASSHQGIDEPLHIPACDDIQALKASTKVAEYKLTHLLDERVKFHAKLQETLKQGNMDKIQLQQLLDVEKLKHESSKKDLEQFHNTFGSLWDAELLDITDEEVAIVVDDTFKENQEKAAKKGQQYLCEDKMQLRLEYTKKLEASQYESLQLKKISQNEISNDKSDKDDLRLREMNILQITEGCAAKDVTSALIIDVPQTKVSQLSTDNGNDYETECINLNYRSDLVHLRSLQQSNRLDTGIKLELFKLMQMQEMHWKTANNAVENLENRLILVEKEKLKLEELVETTKHNVSSDEAGLTKLPQTYIDEDLTKQFSCIYVSPIFEDRKPSRSKDVNNKHGSHKTTNVYSDYSKDLQIQELKAEIQKLRMCGNGVQMRWKGNNYIEKDNMVIRSELNLHDERYLQDFQVPINEYAPHGFMKVMHKKIVEAKRENAGPLFLTADNNEDNIVMKRLCNEELSDGDYNATEVSNGLPYDAKGLEFGRSPCEFHFLKDTVQKLVAACKEWEKGCSKCGELNIDDRESFNVEVPGRSEILSEMKALLSYLNKDPQSQTYARESKTIWKKQVAGDESQKLKACLESTKKQLEDEIHKNKLLLERIENDENYITRLMDEHRLELERKEKTLSFAQQLNSQLANDITKTETTLAELRSQYKGQVASLESQLTDANSDLDNLQQAADQLAQQLADSEARILSLQQSLEDKDKQMEELKRRMLAIQNETDATVMEKFELVTRTQDLRKEYDEQRRRLAELVSVNEELLQFAQEKEDQLTSSNQDSERLLHLIKLKTDESTRLKQELDSTAKELKKLQEEDDALKHRHKFMKVKLYETEYELAQREEALERLTKHLAALIDGGDVSEETGQLKFSLAFASNKEEKLGEQLKQSRLIIDELEEKMLCMEAEVSKARKEMERMKELSPKNLQDENGFLDRSQISVMRSSFPVELQPAYR